MDSDQTAEAIRLAVALASFAAGLAGAAGLRSLSRRGDGRGGRRLSAAMVALSVAAAAGAWAFVAASRYGSAPSLTVAYAAVGLAAGLLTGFFPKAAGLPMFVAAVTVSFVATAGLGSWPRWVAGADAGRLTVYSTGAAGSMCGVATTDGRGRSVESNLELGPGPVTLEFDVVDIRGPLSLVFGKRRYRPTAVLAASSRVVLRGDRGPFLASGDGGILARLLGCSVAAARTDPFEPSVLAAASFVMRPDGTMETVER